MSISNQTGLRRRPVHVVAAAVLTAALVTGCASFRSDVNGSFHPSEDTPVRSPLEPVRVLFVFHHFRQNHGLDTIPKLVHFTTHGPGGDVTIVTPAIKDFSDIFEESLREIHNIEGHATYTEWSRDSSDPGRKDLFATLSQGVDFTIDIRFLEESWFSSDMLAGIISLLTLTVIPTYMTTDFSAEVRVLDSENHVLATYHRSAKLRDWIQVVLMFVYPFHPRERKVEEIYSAFLHDVFRQIDAEGVLDPAICRTGSKLESPTGSIPDTSASKPGSVTNAVHVVVSD